MRTLSKKTEEKLKEIKNYFKINAYTIKDIKENKKQASFTTLNEISMTPVYFVFLVEKNVLVRSDDRDAKKWQVVNTKENEARTWIESYK